LECDGIPSSTRIYIIDSRRPCDIDNLYDEERIRLLVEGGEEMDVPSIGHVYDDEEEEEEISDEEERRSIEALERRVLKKKRREEWKRRRDDILWRYYENNWTAISVGVYYIWWGYIRYGGGILYMAVYIIYGDGI
jgi:hypothetical protein